MPLIDPMFRRPGAGILSCLVAGLLAAGPLAAQTDPTTQIVGGKLYYTTPGAPDGEPRVRVADFRYDGRGLSVTGHRGLLSGPSDSRTLETHPKDPSRLVVDGGGGLNVYVVEKETGAFETFRARRSYQRLSVLSPHVLVTSQGVPSLFPILDDGTLGTAILVRGGSPFVVNPTHIVGTPRGNLFTRVSGDLPTTVGEVGVIEFGPDFTTATSRAFYTREPAARGAIYDPYTRDVLLMGREQIVQIPPVLPDPGEPVDGPIPEGVARGRFVADPGLGQLSFQQGDVDGRGHLFVASPTGHLVLVDFSRSRNIGAPDKTVVVSIPHINDVEIELGRPFEDPEIEEAK